MMPENPDAHASVDSGLGRDLAVLEQKLATLVAHTRALRAANESLRRELAAATARNQTLAGRVAEAKQRLDALMARFPETAA